MSTYWEIWWVGTTQSKVNISHALTINTPCHTHLLWLSYEVNLAFTRKRTSRIQKCKKFESMWSHIFKTLISTLRRLNLNLKG